MRAVRRRAPCPDPPAVPASGHQRDWVAWRVSVESSVPAVATDPDVDPRKLGLLAGVCGGGFVVVAVLVAAGATDGLDSWWNAVLAGWRPDAVVGTSKVLTVVGDVFFTTAFRVAGGIWLLVRRRYPPFWAWVIASVLSPILVEVVKGLYERPRPEDHVWSATGWAFPSGHAASAATNAALIALLLAGRQHRRIATVCGAVWVAAMAGARNVLGAHWLSDVIGGILLGLAVTSATVAAVATVVSARRRGTQEDSSKWDAPLPSRE